MLLLTLVPSKVSFDDSYHMLWPVCKEILFPVARTGKLGDVGEVNVELGLTLLGSSRPSRPLPCARPAIASGVSKGRVAGLRRFSMC